MADLKCKDVVGSLRSDFGSLWHCQERGKSLEITTPYLYPDNSFVTIFVTKRGKRFIVSDGAQASEFLQSVKDDEPFFASLIARGRKAHSVLEFKQGHRTFYFKETKAFNLISSIAFDLAGFLVAISNAAYMSVAEEDANDKNSFRARADKFIKYSIPKSTGKTVEFNRKLPEVKEATFSAIIKSASSLWLVIYLTGSNLKYFQLSVSNAIVNVEFLQRSSLNNHVRAVIPFLNDDAEGYQPNQLTQRMDRLKDLTRNAAIPWRHKDQIIPKIS